MGKIIHIDEKMLEEIILEATQTPGCPIDFANRILAEIKRIQEEEDNRPGSFYN